MRFVSRVHTRRRRFGNDPRHDRDGISFDRERGRESLTDGIRTKVGRRITDRCSRFPIGLPRTGVGRGRIGAVAVPRVPGGNGDAAAGAAEGVAKGIRARGVRPAPPGQPQHVRRHRFRRCLGGPAGRWRVHGRPSYLQRWPVPCVEARPSSSSTPAIVADLDSARPVWEPGERAWWSLAAAGSSVLSARHRSRGSGLRVCLLRANRRAATDWRGHPALT